MTDTIPTNAKQTALLAKVQSYMDEECAAIEAEAQAKARAIIAEAHAAARARVHSAITRIRYESAAEIGKQSARIHTAKRHDLYEQENQFLNTVWPQLDQALQSRWDNPASRRAWLTMVVDAAVARHRSGTWMIEHPADWSPAELEPLMDKIHTVDGVEVSFQGRADVTAGLRILANSAVLDGTLKGLTQDRRTISAMFLAEIFTLAGDEV